VARSCLGGQSLPGLWRGRGKPGEPAWLTAWGMSPVDGDVSSDSRRPAGMRTGCRNTVRECLHAALAKLRGPKRGTFSTSGGGLRNPNERECERSDRRLECVSRRTRPSSAPFVQVLPGGCHPRRLLDRHSRPHGQNDVRQLGRSTARDSG
jgi:hypothetical protein